MSLFFITFLLGHLLGDFYFQSNALAKAKRAKGIKGKRSLARHCIIYAVVCFVCALLGCDLPTALLAALLLGVLHAIIDTVSVVLRQRYCSAPEGRGFSEEQSGEPKKKIRAPLIFFLVDQALHIFCIVLVALFLSAQEMGMPFSLELTHQLAPQLGLAYQSDCLPTLCIDDSTLQAYKQGLAWLTAILLCIWPAMITVRLVMESLRVGNKEGSRIATVDNASEAHCVGGSSIQKNDDETGKESKAAAETEKRSDTSRESMLQAGSIIGVLERLAILLFWPLAGAATGAFAVAIKALARFKQLDDIETAELFLVGTFTSVLFAGAALLLVNL